MSGFLKGALLYFAIVFSAGFLLGTLRVLIVVLLAAKVSLVLWLRGLTIREYIATQDPVSGTAYCLALALFGVMPLLVGGSIAPTRR